ncbi:MAG: DUF2064 domain-containing protein [Bacteroidetes bacterium]|nr:DUF2064 domain-containing protein [Bacteroidota bacterium]
MEEIFSNTAILIFTRTDEQEASAKTFVQGISRSGNIAIAQHLIHHTLGTALKTGLPVIVSMGSDQVGDTFGERFAHAIEGVFAEGYENVIAIGNDCPTLSAPLLLGAARRLENGGLVLGPAMDGGVYLLGISENCFDRAAFTALPWETSYLQSGLSAYAESQSIGISWLIKKSDVDDSFSFFAALGQLGFRHSLRKKLVALFSTFQKLVAHSIEVFPKHLYQPSNELRGPPAYLTLPFPPLH